MKVTSERLEAILRHVEAKGVPFAEVHLDGQGVHVVWPKGHGRKAAAATAFFFGPFEEWEPDRCSGRCGKGTAEDVERVRKALVAAGFEVERRWTACGACGSEHVLPYDACKALSGDVVGDLAADLVELRAEAEGLRSGLAEAAEALSEIAWRAAEEYTVAYAGRAATAARKRL